MTRRINGTIYLIKNKINGKVYVGQTIQKPSKRFHDHFQQKRKDTILLTKARDKYGKESFELEILETNITDRDILNDREAYFIAHYNSKVPNGYNIAPGGASTYSQPKLNERQEQQVVDLYSQGYSMKQIGKMFGRDKKAIKGALVRNGIESRPTKTKYLNITRDMLVTLINEGSNLADIAKHFGVVSSNISYYVKKYGLKELYENRRKTVNTEM